MRHFLISTALCVAGTVQAAAETVDEQGCTVAQAKMAQAAMKNAKRLTQTAAAVVGDTATYERWFGDYDQQNAEEVRATLKSIVVRIRSGEVTPLCESEDDYGCHTGEYAWVYGDEPNLIHLCPRFFDLPNMNEFDPTARASNYGTQEGTIIHEISHFYRVASTEDHCYSRMECSDMADWDPDRVIENADSYQYFAEDVIYYASRPIAAKPGRPDEEED